MASFDVNVILKIPSYAGHMKKVKAAMVEHTKTTDKDITVLLDKAVVPGKNLRASLLLYTNTSLGGKVDPKVIAACASIELAHLASLVHDDILDKSETRRGEPTIYAEAGAEKALLLGDYLFACSTKAAAAAGEDVAGIMADAVANLCEGQFIETADCYNIKRAKQRYFKAVEGKTGAFIVAGLQSGAVLAGNKDTLKSLEAFGKSFGTIFQVIDDIMDLISTKDNLGKPVHKDLKEGTYTLPVLHALANAKSAKVVQPYIQVAKNLQYDHDRLIHDLHEAGGFTEALKQIKTSTEDCQKALKDHKELAGLTKFAKDFTTWALKNLPAKEHKAVVKG